MVDIRHLKCLAQRACEFESRPGHNIKNETALAVHFLVVPREYDTCVSYVETRIGVEESPVLGIPKTRRGDRVSPFFIN